MIEDAHKIRVLTDAATLRLLPSLAEKTRRLGYLLTETPDITDETRHLNHDAAGGIAPDSSAPPQLLLIGRRRPYGLGVMQAIAARCRSLNVPVLFLAGCPDMAELDAGGLRPPLSFLPDPFTEKDLDSAVRLALYSARKDRCILASEHKYRSLVENSLEGIAVIQDGRLRFGNAQLEAITGYYVSDFRTIRLEDVFGSEHFAEIRRNLKNRPDSWQPPGALTVPFIRKDGSRTWLDLKVEYIEWENRPALLCYMNDAAARVQAEKALRESEARFRRIVETANEGIWALDENSDTVFVNQVLAGILGYEPEDMIGRKVTDFMFPEDLPVHQFHMEKRRSGETERYERKFRHRDGSPVWVYASAVPVVSERGEFKGAFAMLTDITARKLAEDAKETAEEKFRALADQTPVSIMAFDQSGRVIFVNQWHLNVFSLGKHSEDFFLGKKISELPGLISAGVVPQIEKVLEGETVILDEVYFPESFGGPPVYRYLKAVPLRKDGDIIGSILIGEDITERKKTEEALRAAEEKFRTLAEQAPVSIMAFDENGIVTFVNRWHITTFGAGKYNEKFFLGRKISGLPGLLRAGVAHEVENVLDGKTIILDKVFFPVFLRGGSGYQSIKAVPHFQDGKIAGGILIREDITAIVRAQDELESALHEKEILLKEIHHRVKNNMQVVSSLLNLQINQTREPRITEALMESRNRVTAMALVHESLYLSQSIAEINLRHYLNGLTVSLIRSYAVESRYPALQLDVPPDLAVGLDHAAPFGLVLNELISNSLKHAFPKTPNGKITIRARQAEDGTITLTVSDNGVGLPEGFDWRNSDTLGLPMVVSLVESQLDGTIDLEADGGARFTIVVPGKPPATARA